jgi:hypothetical protein
MLISGLESERNGEAEPHSLFCKSLLGSSQSCTLAAYRLHHLRDVKAAVLADPCKFDGNLVVRPMQIRCEFGGQTGLVLCWKW